MEDTAAPPKRVRDKEKRAKEKRDRELRKHQNKFEHAGQPYVKGARLQPGGAANSNHPVQQEVEQEVEEQPVEGEEEVGAPINNQAVEEKSEPLSLKDDENITTIVSDKPDTPTVIVESVPIIAEKSTEKSAEETPAATISGKEQMPTISGKEQLLTAPSEKMSSGASSSDTLEQTITKEEFIHEERKKTLLIADQWRRQDYQQETSALWICMTRPK